MTIDPFRELAAAMRSRAGFEGTMLKFAKGQWTHGREPATIEMNDSELVAHVDQLVWGFIKWEQKKPVDYHVGFVRDRYKPPKRGELGDTDPKKWEREKADPWQLTFVLWLTGQDDPDQLYFYSTTTSGGRDCLANLQDAFSDHRDGYPDEAHKLPIVALCSDHYPHPEFGRVEYPVLDIVRWVDPPTRKPVKLPASSSPTTLAIEALPKKSNDPDEEIPF